MFCGGLKPAPCRVKEVRTGKKKGRAGKIPTRASEGAGVMTGRSLYHAAAELWEIPAALVEAAERAEEQTASRRAFWRTRSDRVFLKVLKAFQAAGVTETHLGATTGYGYGDFGRDTLDSIFAQLFGTEAALVRLQIVSGTHALSLCLRAVAGPGDVLVLGTGRPYDTLRPQVDELRQVGVRYVEVGLDATGRMDPKAVAGAVGEAAVAVRTASMGGGTAGPARGPVTGGRVCLLLQRSRGYEPVPSRGVALLGEAIARAQQEAERAGVELVAVVDNCYGEFVEEREPGHVGADLVAGSLIKNPGGGLAPTGGYVAGRRDLVKRAAELLTAPGVGGETGPTLGLGRLFYQGLFLAPRAVGAALAGAVFAAAFFESLGLEVSPRWDEERTDIIQSVRLGTREGVLALARAVQAASPVDSKARPVGDALPGYDDEVVMAAGTFVQGASLELSLDAPLRPPYAAYLQGGLYEGHLKLAALLGAAEMARQDLLGGRSRGG